MFGILDGAADIMAMDIDMAGDKVSVARVQTQDREVNQLQQNVITGINQLQNQLTSTPSNGTFLDTHLNTGDTVVNHNLGRLPTGYIITNNNSAAIIFRKEFTASTVILNSSQGVDITLFLF